MSDFSAARTVLAAAVAGRAFPAAVVEAGSSEGVRWRDAFGTLTGDPGAPETSETTIFDLASLTKVLATTTIVMRLVERGALELGQPVARCIPSWRGGEREAVTVADLLAHCSGLPAWRPLYREHTGREAFTRAIAALPLEYPPRSRAIYSDLGFILLGFIAEDAGAAPLDVQFRGLFPEGDGARPGFELTFRPPAGWRARVAPTEVDSWRGRLLVGEVHDENAAALGGGAGPAGLFGTAAAVGVCARLIVRTLRGNPSRSPFAAPDVLARFVAPSDVPGSSRALGWDTMRPTSSCGHRLSSRAIGHTGFTGTSLWIDPERDLYVVLLTNRVHPTRANVAIRQVRPALHDAIVEEWTDT